MNFNWPKLKTIKANEVANDLKLLCRFLDSNTPLSTEEKIHRFNQILKDANDRKFYDGKLRNGERREEFKNLTSIVNSIFMYFHSSEMHYKVRPKVFKDNINFFSHR